MSGEGEKERGHLGSGETDLNVDGCCYRRENRIQNWDRGAKRKRSPDSQYDHGTWIEGRIVGSGEGQHNSVYYFVRSNLNKSEKDVYMHPSKLNTVDKFFRLENGTELIYTVHTRKGRPEVKYAHISLRIYKIETLLQVMEITSAKKKEVKLTLMLRAIHAFGFLGI